MRQRYLSGWALAVGIALLAMPVALRAAAATTHAIAIASTNNGATYTSGSFTPATDDLLAVFISVSNTADDGALSDSLGGSWTEIRTNTRSATDKQWLYVRTTLASNSAMTVTMDVTGDDGTGACGFVFRISGMTKTGTSAVKQTAITTDTTGGNTPAPTFGASATTTNPTYGFLANQTNPAGLTPPTNWTEDAAGDNGYDTPTRGCEYVYRDSGFTGTTMTWGGTSPSNFSTIIAEFDASAASGGGGGSSGRLTLLGVGEAR